MAINKVVYGSETLIDLTADTATAADVAQGKTFHLANGVQATGTASGDPYPVRNDGKTHLWVVVDDLAQPEVTLYYRQSTAGAVKVDWGDGTVNVPVTSIAGSARHTYAQTGLYEIVLYSESGGYLNYSGAWGTSSNNCVMGSAKTNPAFNRGRLKAAEFSDFGSTNANARKVIGYALYNCGNIEKVTLSGAFTSFTINQAVSLANLAVINLPDTVTSLSFGRTSSNEHLVSLRKVRMPSGLTSVGQYCFVDCSQLQSIDIPAAVASISASAFANCYSLAAIHFEPTAPPTLADDTVFTDLPTTCTIYVPTGTLAAYTAAANYPDPSVYTYEEE